VARSGKCLCGAISYTVDGEPAHSALCWCERCRRSAGATPVGWALFPNDAVTITGSPVSYESTPDTYREFCGTCGTGLFFRSEAIFPGQVDIQIATFDDPDAFPPQAHIQVADAPAWIDRHGDLPRFKRFPGMPE
jgi:hypothetical protein